MKRKPNFFAPKKILTVDEIIKEALIAGVGYYDVYNHTCGELIEIINAYNEKIRRQNKDFSLIAMRHAQLVVAYVAGSGKNLEIYDIFPFWSKEEKDQLKVEKYLSYMRAQVAKRGENEI